MSFSKKAKIITACAGGALLGFQVFVATRYIPRAGRAKPGKRQLVCIGDSITFGAGVVWARERNAWPFQLGRLLGEDWQVLDYGVSGATAQDEADFPYVKHGFLKAAEKARPELTLLMLGTNDSKPYNWNAERYERDICRLIDELSTVSRRLVLLLPPKAFPGKNGVVGFDICDEIICSEILPILRAAAEKRSLPVVDLYAFTQDHPEYFGDGVHPNIQGNRAIAAHVAQELRRLGID